MPDYTDQIGRTITLTGIPQRIVSLVPSHTELLYNLGLDKEIIGITSFCIHPRHWFQSKTRVGGTKKLHVEQIKQLQPHLIIANKEENLREQVEELAAQLPVWTSNISNLQQALQMIEAIGAITGTAEKANQLTEKIN